MHTADTQRKGPSKKRKGRVRGLQIQSLLQCWGFRTSEESSSPNLALVSLKKVRMIDWPRTVMYPPELALNLLSQSVIRICWWEAETSKSFCLMLSGFSFKSRESGRNWTS